MGFGRNGQNQGYFRLYVHRMTVINGCCIEFLEKGLRKQVYLSFGVEKLGS